MKRSLTVKMMLMGMVLLAGLFAFAPATFAQDHAEGEEVAGEDLPLIHI